MSRNCDVVLLTVTPVHCSVSKCVCVFVCCRRLQIEELEARIALMPLLQAEHDRR